MADRTWNIAGGLAGVVFVGLTLAGMAIGGSPNVEPSDSASTIARALADSSDKAGLGSFITLLGLVFFFPFLAYLRNQLQRSEGEKGWLATTAYGGGLVTAAMLLLGVSVQLATTSVSPDVDQVVGKVFVVYTWNWIAIVAPPMMALTLGASLAIIRHGVAPRWIGWLGVLVSITLLAPWIGILVALGWLLVLSVVLVLSELKHTEAAA